MKRPINKLAFAAHACALQGVRLQSETVARLRRARQAMVGLPLLDPVEAVLVSVVDLYIERGPVSQDITGMVNMAVKLCAREWAQTSEPGTPPAKLDYWYNQGDMQ